MRRRRMRLYLVSKTVDGKSSLSDLYSNDLAARLAFEERAAVLQRHKVAQLNVVRRPMAAKGVEMPGAHKAHLQVEKRL